MALCTVITRPLHVGFPRLLLLNPSPSPLSEPFPRVVGNSRSPQSESFPHVVGVISRHFSLGYPSVQTAEGTPLFRQQRVPLCSDSRAHPCYVSLTPKSLRFLTRFCISFTPLMRAHSTSDSIQSPF